MDPKRATGFAAGLAALAALRVLVYALAFPFFNQVDEHQHVDSVVRYARGELPGAEMRGLDSRTARWSLEFGTFEYLSPGPVVPLPYLARPGAHPRDPLVRKANQAFLDVRNNEHDSPPVYFIAAGSWLRLGEAVGLDGRPLLYWLRGLNALMLGGLVFASFRVLRTLFPERAGLHLGVPALVAFTPQDCLFGVTTDAMALGTGGVAFLGLAWLGTRREPAPRAAYAAVGLAVAAAFLTKYTSLFLVAGAAALALGELVRGGDRWRAGFAARWAAWSAAAGLPVALWLVRNRAVLGDWSGTARKVAHLEWTPRPPAEWLDHPVVTPSGFAEFVGRLIPRFWRGEFLWHGEEMALPAADVAYTVLTLSLVAVVLVVWAKGLRAPRPGPDPARVVDGLALLSLGLAVATLALLSMRFTFADWGTPTADDPYFVHGRLISGAVWPACWLWVRGLEALCRRLPERLRQGALWAALALLLVAITVSEAVVNAPVFASPWNALG
ncbi:MAG: hypothetical protein ACQGVK_21200 [Myxococcota bacterium]